MTWDEELRDGGQGSVSKVIYHRKPHAAKEISLRNCKNPTEMKLKIEEIQNEFAIMIKGNQCPEIIHSYGIIQHRESLIIIMEYASNGSLRDYLNDHKNTPLSKDLVCSLISDIVCWNGLSLFSRC